jgi:hypothetical protein
MAKGEQTGQLYATKPGIPACDTLEVNCVYCESLRE